MSILYKTEAEDIPDKPKLETDRKICNSFYILDNKSINEMYKSELQTILSSVEYSEAESNVHKIKHKKKNNRYTNFFKNFNFFYEKACELSASELNNIAKTIIETGLTRKDIVCILTGIESGVFEQYKYNPEEFILKSAQLINEQKATAIIEHITYNILDERYGTEIFTEPTIKGKLNINAMKANKHLYNHIVYDSKNECDFATKLDTNKSVAVYVKLPSGFYISTPVGKYNPDWSIAFYEGTVKHIYFVAETKGSLDSLQLGHISPLERYKIKCAEKHFEALSDNEVVYKVVDNYKELLDIVTE